MFRLSFIVLTLVCSNAFAQPISNAISNDRQIASIYEKAWVKQPEALSLTTKLTGLEAQKKASQSWSVEPPAIDFATRTDRILRNQGGREYGVGLSVPLWLAGEQKRTGVVVDSLVDQTQARLTATKLRVSGIVRDLYWNFQRAKADVEVANDKVKNAQAIGLDVNRRQRAGDLARADLFQAEGAVALAQGSAAEARGVLDQALQRLIAITNDLSVKPSGEFTPEKELTDTQKGFDQDRHPSLIELKTTLIAAQAVADLVVIQKRGNPEVVVSTTRERGSFADGYQQTIGLGLRVPLGSAPRFDAKVAASNAAVIEAQSALAIETARISGEIKAAELLLNAVQAQVAAAERRASLALETKGFFEKSFRLGETDLPTRLRIELEAAEAQRQLARARVDRAAAISNLLQASGLLPE
jgi:outer membrane protein, heavy metal efflux system